MLEATKPDGQYNLNSNHVVNSTKPLLIIGLGGTGAETVHVVKKNFATYLVHPNSVDHGMSDGSQRIAFLVIDSDMHESSRFCSDEFVDISIPGLIGHMNRPYSDAYISQNDHKWLDKHLTMSNGSYGSYPCRQVVRLMLFRNYKRVSAALCNALLKITTQSAVETAANCINIVLATGIIGSTGSGLFLDVAQIVHHIMRTESRFAGLRYTIKSYIMMPDISMTRVAFSAPYSKVFMAVGFAALKELDFWMRVDEHQTPYAAQIDDNISISWAQPPFSSCTLMCTGNAQGLTHIDPYKLAIHTISENLVYFYLAEENPDSHTPEFTHSSYEANIWALLTMMKKRYPLFYGYQAIGGYTENIVDVQALFYEANLIIKSLRIDYDLNTNSIPTQITELIGQPITCVQDIIGDINKLILDFRRSVDLPLFCKVTVDDRERIRQLYNMNPEPHECVDDEPLLWRETVVQPKAIQAAMLYYDSIWNRFQTFVRRAVISRNIGIYGLRRFFEGETGFCKVLEAISIQWAHLETLLKNAEDCRLKECQGTRWQKFIKPPLIGSTKAKNEYLQALLDYYNSVTEHVFIIEYVQTINLFCAKVKGFFLDSLNPLCDDLSKLEEEFCNHKLPGNPCEGTLLKLDVLRYHIDEKMRIIENDGMERSVLLEGLCQICLSTVKGINSSAIDSSFIYKESGKQQLIELIREMTSSYFCTINCQSLDKIMEDSVGTDSDKQKEYMDNLAQSILTCASPLIMQNAVFSCDDKLSYSYLSVPSNAKKFLEHYKSSLASINVQATSSLLHNNIYCINTYYGLPLFRYCQISKLEDAYEDAIVEPRAYNGLHLVFDGDSDSDFSTNWFKLPSPRPSFFFPRHNQSHDEKRYLAICSLVERARLCGILSVDTADTFPSILISLLYHDTEQSTLKSSVTICEDVDGLIEQYEHISDKYMRSERTSAEISRYLGSATFERIKVSSSLEFLTSVLGLSDGYCNPKDRTISESHELKDTAERNQLKLSHEMASVIIYLNPKYETALIKQIEGWEYAKSSILYKCQR